MDDNVEQLSRVLHGIYQEEANRQSSLGEDTVRHPDEYDALAEHTKEYDRVLARYILSREEPLRREIARYKELVAASQRLRKSLESPVVGVDGALVLRNFCMALDRAQATVQ